ncbi:MAG: hypothetical protein HKL82_07385 [Acidimicrobiaceae bacterium]|nr:hypothetical protein [Acidimicrobiaceae bacterium]
MAQDTFEQRLAFAVEYTTVHIDPSTGYFLVLKMRARTTSFLMAFGSGLWWIGGILTNNIEVDGTGLTLFLVFGVLYGRHLQILRWYRRYLKIQDWKAEKS